MPVHTPPSTPPTTPTRKIKTTDTPVKLNRSISIVKHSIDKQSKNSSLNLLAHVASICAETKKDNAETEKNMKQYVYAYYQKEQQYVMVCIDNCKRELVHGDVVKEIITLSNDMKMKRCFYSCLRQRTPFCVECEKKAYDKCTKAKNLFVLC